MDAYIPKSIKESILGEDYQRIANNLCENGCDCQWDSDGVYVIADGHRIDMNMSFLYPHTLNLKRKHFNNILMIKE